MKQIQVPRYVADDGQEFDTMESCRMHEATLSAEGLVAAYFIDLEKAKACPAGRQRARLSNALTAFARWSIVSRETPAEV